MLDDRHYMRPDGRHGSSWVSTLPLTIWLMISLVVAFAVQQIDIVYLHGQYIDDLALTRECLTRGYVWQLLTFQFLHYDLLHLIFNLIGLWFFGRFVEERLGRFNLFKLYLRQRYCGRIVLCRPGLDISQSFRHCFGRFRWSFGTPCCFRYAGA